MVGGCEGVGRWELAGPQGPVRWLPARRLPGQARRSATEGTGPGRRGRASFLVDDLRQPVELDGRSTSDSTGVAALAGATTSVHSGRGATIHAATATIERGSTTRVDLEAGLPSTQVVKDEELSDAAWRE
uniref:Uncharacterized protein n=1 Tax=Salinispora arenicola (strain CNS-205) TaxID=391037 RepID=A8M7H9_SALAI